MKKTCYVLSLLIGLTLSGPVLAGSMSLLGAGGGGGGAPAYTGPLDINGTAYAFWSTRCGSGTYSGNVAEIHNASTDATYTTVTCDGAGNLVTSSPTALATTCSGGCNVKVIYDQSASNKCSGACDVVQATVANRPTVTTSCQNSKMCFVFTAYGTTCMLSANASASQAQPWSFSAVLKGIGNFNYLYFWSYGSGLAIYNVGSLLGLNFGTGVAGVTGTTFGSLLANQLLASGSSSTWYVNGSDSASNPFNPGTGGPTSGSPMALGNAVSCSGAAWGGQWFETGIWNGDKTANKATMNTNQRTYWSF
jgi:hypothetical protein